MFRMKKNIINMQWSFFIYLNEYYINQRLWVAGKIREGV